jgi:predicted lysophospholipase L1 biosynthesis ABC-type transport system permease subunit
MMSAALTACGIRLRSSRRRTAAAAAIVAVAGLLLGTAITVGYGLTTGFDRAADRADLPDVIARFDERPVADVDRTLRALPNLSARSYRFEATSVGIAARSHFTERGAVEVVGPGRRGYAILAGRDVAGAGRGVVIERGLARAWDLGLGDVLRIRQLGSFRVAGIAVDPENVAYPLASQAHVWLSIGVFAQRPAARLARTNVALLWLVDRSQGDVTLQQARTASYGFGGLRLLTRAGVAVQLHEAAGVVVALLAAVSLIAALAAGVLLGAGAHADVQRSLGTLGVQRALGFPAAALTGGWALAGVAVALPAGALGLAAGALLAHHPTASLLADLNELAPRIALLRPLAGALAAMLVMVALATALPAWRALRAPPVRLLRGAELAPTRRTRRLRRAGPALLGARLVLARRARAGSTIAVLAATGSVLALLLALATLLTALRDDPGALGRRYQLSVPAPARDASRIARLPGVQAAAPRYAVDAAASFALQEPVRVIAFPGDHTPFEAPPLAAGRRLRSAAEVEVGQGLADALGVRVGGTLAVQTSGGELRLRVAGIVRALEHDGRVAYARAGPVLRVLPGAPAVVAIRLRPGADAAAVRRAVQDVTGIAPRAPATATPRSRAFLGTLAAVVRVLAIVVGGVSLLALAQALAVTARERRATIAVLRSGGAGAAAIARLLAGAVAVLLIPGALLGLALERWVLGPAVTSLAAGYADLSLAPGAGQVALAGGVFALLAALAVALTLRRLLREAITAGLVAP